MHSYQKNPVLLNNTMKHSRKNINYLGSVVRTRVLMRIGATLIQLMASQVHLRCNVGDSMTALDRFQ